MEWLWWFWFCAESIALKMALSLLKKYKGKEIQGSLTQNICSPLTIESLKEMVTKSTEEVWAFTEIENDIYSARITIEEGYVLLKSLSKRNPPATAVKIPYQEVKNLMNRNNITTFLEINLSQIDDSYDKLFIHIQLQGGEGRTKQFELMCSGEDSGISYAKTTFLNTLKNWGYAALLGGVRNDGCNDALQEMTVGGKIIKPITPGLVASDHEYKDPDYYPDEDSLTTRFVIYTKGDPTDTEECYIGKVAYGLNGFKNVYLQAKIHEANLIDIADCGIVLTAQETLSIPSPITIDYLKEMVTQSTSGVWAVLKMKDQIYSAQIVIDKGFLLLRSLVNRAPPENSITIPYRKVKNLVDRENITTFLEINLSEEENSNFGNRFIHIKLNGDEERHLQFEVMCTGEVDGISYAKTVFLETDTDSSVWTGLIGGARNDGKDTELPGFTLGERARHELIPGLVDSWWDNNPTNFMICTEKRKIHVDSPLGNIVLGMDHVQNVYSKAKEKGAGYVQIDGCGIVLD